MSPCQKLRIGLKCGGSDGLSGITANPMLGVFSDYLVAQGGTTVLTEVPEMFGAETLLMNRCRTQEIFDDTVTMIKRLTRTTSSAMTSLYMENPCRGKQAEDFHT